MRKKSMLMTAVMMAAIVWALPTVAQKRTESTVIENPQFSVSNTGTLTIDRVELLPDSTRLHMTAYHSPRSWVRIARGTYIRVKGEKLMMTSAEGITPDKEFYSDETNQTHFVLNFPAVPADAQTLDFYESDCEDCFKFWDVALTPEAQQIAVSTPADIQAWANIPDDGKPLVTPTWKSGKATVKGFIRGYKPEMGKEIIVYYDNPVTSIHEMHGIEIKPDGTFNASIPIATTDASVFARMPNSTISFLIAEGQEVEMYIDRVAEVHQRIPNKALQTQQQQTIFFRGAHADINNCLQTEEAKSFDTYIPTKKYLKDIADMSLEEYKSYYMDFCQKQLAVLEELPFSGKMKEFLGLELKQDVCHSLFFGDSHLESAFRQKHNLGRRDTLKGYSTPVFTEKYYSFLKELDMNNPKNLLHSTFSNNVNSCKFINYNLYDYNALMHSTTAKEFLKEKTLNREEKKLMKKISGVKTMQEFRELLKTNEALASTWKNMQKRFYDLMKGQRIPLQIQTAAKLMGTDKSIVFDLMTAQTLCAPLEEKMPIPEEDFHKAEQLENPFFVEYMREKNAELAAELEAQKQKGGYTVHQAGESLGEALLVDIVQQFKGKVIFIDLWATWCGPCRSAMTRFEPIKEKLQELKGKDLAFVYLTDESSPEKAWKNMIPNIKGEHYRLSNSQLGSLKLMFNFTGIPSYLIVSKEGKVVYSHVGFEGNEKIARLLIEELKK